MDSFFKSAELGSSLTTQPWSRFISELKKLEYDIDDLKNYKMVGYKNGQTGQGQFLDEYKTEWIPRYKIDDNEHKCVCKVRIVHLYYVVDIEDKSKPALIVGSDCMENWGIRVGCLKCFKKQSIHSLKGGICKTCRVTRRAPVAGFSSKHCKKCNSRMNQVKYPEHHVCWSCCQSNRICYRCGKSVGLTRTGNPWAYCWTCYNEK